VGGKKKDYKEKGRGEGGGKRTEWFDLWTNRRPNPRQKEKDVSFSPKFREGRGKENKVDNGTSTKKKMGKRREAKKNGTLRANEISRGALWKILSP